MIVPTGTLIIISSPFFPSLRELAPGLPFPAKNFRLYLKFKRVERLDWVSKIMLPPVPPFPPEG